MSRMRRFARWARLAPPAVVLTAALAAATASASPAAPGPLDITGEINGAPFRIILPADWNGKLIVLAHGYRDKADHPGEVDNRAPLDAGLAPAFLAQGWGVLGTAYKANGWAVKEALDDLVALTSYFKDNVAKPERTYLMGFSMGSVPTLRLAEQNGGAFDGYVAACSVGAGTPRGSDWILSTMLAYDVIFGEPAAWGTPGNADDDVDFETEVLPVLIPQLVNPANFAKFEFIRLVAGTPGRGLPLGGLFPTWALQDFFFATEAGGELERRAGGPVAQNLTHTYGLTAVEVAYLASLGLDAGPLLAAMNGRRTISAPPSSRNYVEHYAEYSGKIKKPVIALHTELDGLTPASHVSAYQETVEAAGRSDLFFRAFTTGVGHCTFSPTQLVATANALDGWVETDVPPTDAAFPAVLGFDQGFVPPAWLQP